MAAALRFAARKVSGRALQQATAFVPPSPAVREEQRRLLPRLIPGAGGRMPLLRSFSSAGAAPNNKNHDHLPQSKHIVDVELELSRIPASIRPQVKTWYDRHFPHAEPTVNGESGISNKEPASLRAQVEEKKIELFHLLSQLKYTGENSNLEDERILRQLPPYRELKHLVNGYGIKLVVKRIAIASVLSAIFITAMVKM